MVVTVGVVEAIAKSNQAKNGLTQSTWLRLPVSRPLTEIGLIKFIVEPC